MHHYEFCVLCIKILNKQFIWPVLFITCVLKCVNILATVTYLKTDYGAKNMSPQKTDDQVGSALYNIVKMILWHLGPISIYEPAHEIMVFIT